MANLQLIKVLARRKDISIKELADDLGITQQAMSLMMRTGSTKIDTLERIAEKLGVSPSVFFEDTPPAIATDHSIAVSGNKNKVNQAQEDKYLALLAKKDEQIDRLLALLEQLNK